MTPEQNKLIAATAKACKWDFNEVTEFYLSLLTEINFHRERVELEKIIFDYIERVENENINTFYRLDEYPGPVGNLIGFYGDLASAIEEAETDGPIKKEDHEPTQYPYLQITEFITVEDKPSQYAWEIGSIVNDHFFIYT